MMTPEVADTSDVQIPSQRILFIHAAGKILLGQSKTEINSLHNWTPLQISLFFFPGVRLLLIISSLLSSI